MRMGEIASMFYGLSYKIGCCIFLIDSLIQIIRKPRIDRADKEKYDQEQNIIKSKNAKTIALYNQELERRDEIIKKIELSQAISRKNLDLYKSKYTYTKQLLKKYYDLDILYYKYRGLARVSKYIEFLESGICSSLKGDKGAYQFCEIIIREDIKIENSGIIIDKLSEIIMGINKMQETNTLMYYALRDVSQVIDHIQHEMEQHNKSLIGLHSDLGSIEKSSQATAYFSEIIAKSNQLLVDYAEYQDFATRQKRLEDKGT